MRVCVCVFVSILVCEWMLVSQYSLSVFLCLCLSVSLSIHLFCCLFVYVCLSFRLRLGKVNTLSTYISFTLFILLNVRICISVSVCLSVRVSQPLFHIVFFLCQSKFFSLSVPLPLSPFPSPFKHKQVIRTWHKRSPVIDGLPAPSRTLLFVYWAP